MDVPSAPAKPQRVLACVRCQQRKVKCNRNFPCSNCIRSKVQCEPAAPILHRRKRRFPERELLSRIRDYEGLLSQNGIPFEPLHKDATVEEPSNSLRRELNHWSEDKDSATQPGCSSPSTPISHTKQTYGAKHFWHAMNNWFQGSASDSDTSDDDLRENGVGNTWSQLLESDDHLLFGSQKTITIENSSLHPEPVQMFRLWQIYLENVNPLLKIIHTPSFQTCIIEASSNISSINPSLEALMFSIYCMSILSISPSDCQDMFGSSKKDLLERYQLGCRQALSKCRFLRSNERDSLTALYLYLISVRHSTVPQSLSSMLGVAIRIAQRMGLNSESALARCTPLEGEMRRRLWWSLVLFDSRVNELSGFKTTALSPTWDCRLPLNISDSELLPSMKELPQIQAKLSDALFAVVHSELGHFLRSTSFYLGLTNPALIPLAKVSPTSMHTELATLEQRIEEKYLGYCDPEIPLHFMTIWMSRGWLAKYRLMEFHSRHSSAAPQEESQVNAALSYALRMLECDTKITTSPLTKGFRWLAQLYFPLPAYILIVQYLRGRPMCAEADYAWKIMSDNYDAHFSSAVDNFHIHIFKLFSSLIIQAWEARVASIKGSTESLAVPGLVTSMKKILDHRDQSTQKNGLEQRNGDAEMSTVDSQLPVPTSRGDHDHYMPPPSDVYSNFSGMNFMEFDTSHLDWPAVDWGMGECQGWGGW